MNQKIEQSVKNNFPALLDVSGLKTYFYTEEGIVKAVDQVSLSVSSGQALGLVGESGCGKTITALSVLRLVRPPGKIIAGSVKMKGKDLLNLSDDEMRKIRGEQITMIFQQPQSSLNPVFTIGSQLAEVYEIHRSIPKKEGWERSVELLRQVGIPDAPVKAHAYPHELSGGQAQRVMIAMALALKPSLLIADEPTTALDVTVQAQILDLMRELRAGLEATAVILITHDLGVVAETVDHVAVMYAGQIVENADVVELFDHPKHPYTLGLMDSLPVLNERKARLEVIPGNVPSLIGLPPGCRFAERCKARLENNLEICLEVEPELLPVSADHTVRCWLFQEAGSA